MIIEKFLPNPVGDDTVGEQIVLKNDGTTPVSLLGWKLTVSNRGSYRIKNGELAAGASRVFLRGESKLTLRNAAETITLFDASGKVIDTLSFSGTAAKEGEWITHAGREALTQAAPKNSSYTATPEVRFETHSSSSSALGSPSSIGSLLLTWIVLALFFALFSFYAFRSSS